MKTLEKLILKACAYAVLVTTLFFIFTMMTSFTEAAIKMETFMLILLFGALIAVADLIFGIKKLRMGLRVLIHYGALLLTFIVIFIISGNITVNGPGAVFSAIFIFTILYAVLFLLVYLFVRSIKAVDTRIEKRIPKKEAEKPKYKSLYKSDEQ